MHTLRRWDANVNYRMILVLCQGLETRVNRLLTKLFRGGALVFLAHYAGRNSIAKLEVLQKVGERVEA